MKLEHWIFVTFAFELAVALGTALQDPSRIHTARAVFLAACWGGSIIQIVARHDLDVAKRAVAELEDKR